MTTEMTHQHEAPTGGQDRLEALSRAQVEALRRGDYSDVYFNSTKRILERTGHRPRVLMQVFQRHEAVLCGIDEAIRVLREGTGHLDPSGNWVPGFDDLVVRALPEGARIGPWEPVMTIEGDYASFAHLETVYLGLLARRTLIATNTAAVVAAAGAIPVLFFAARFDHHATQEGDGWAAHIGGAAGVSTASQAALFGGAPVGTVPHALIAAYGGDTVAAARAFAEVYAGTGMRLAPLVDFHNDCTRTAVEVADALGSDLWGVRLDTGGQMVDRALVDRMGGFRPTGVCAELVFAVREALDAAGHQRIKILVSGGFDAAKIRSFAARGVPVDAYGVGSSLLRGENDFTADIVRTDGAPSAKVGRAEIPSDRLERVR
ncbi:nicotinate phosphoribosyltransferase [Miltoncostaea oceani]|uniref:nicotinate phosphoribosyltransferase n=1 Tax=Miltoncostaea oceani TaxID=2843216 RepID=UPI001FEA92AC|nr:nicotinate phosphoribosyltransferase [Miltoncostaea oceani]